MRLIDADELEEKLKKHIQTADDKKGGYRAGVAAARIFVAMAPTVDAEAIVLCQDCIHFNDHAIQVHGAKEGECRLNGLLIPPAWHCADGVKKEVK